MLTTVPNAKEELILCRLNSFKRTEVGSSHVLFGEKIKYCRQEPTPGLDLVLATYFAARRSNNQRNILQKMNHAPKNNTWYMISIDSVVVF